MYCLEVSPELRKIVMKTKRIFIDWNSCRVEDSLPIIRCFKCNGFGHKSDVCSLADSRCGHCGGPHVTKVCNETRNKFFCTNCDKHNKIQNQKQILNTKHSAYDGSCKYFIRIQETIKFKINYA